MYRVTTQSGTEYVVRNGRLTRDAEYDPYTPPDMQPPPIVNRPFVADTTPTVGARWRFRLTGSAFFVTSPVVSVARYCAGCDTYGDLFFCGEAEREYRAELAAENAA